MQLNACPNYGWKISFISSKQLNLNMIKSGHSCSALAETPGHGFSTRTTVLTGKFADELPL
jgi:hypothetical protein